MSSRGQNQPFRRFALKAVDALTSFEQNASIQHGGTLASHRKVENRLAHRGDAIVWRTDQAPHDAGKRGQFLFTGIALGNYS